MYEQAMPLMRRSGSRQALHAHDSQEMKNQPALGQRESESDGKNPSRDSLQCKWASISEPIVISEPAALPGKVVSQLRAHLASPRAARFAQRRALTR